MSWAQKAAGRAATDQCTPVAARAANRARGARTLLPSRSRLGRSSRPLRASSRRSSSAPISLTARAARGRCRARRAARRRARALRQRSTPQPGPGPVATPVGSDLAGAAKRVLPGPHALARRRLRAFFGGRYRWRAGRARGRRRCAGVARWAPAGARTWGSRRFSPRGCVRRGCAPYTREGAVGGGAWGVRRAQLRGLSSCVTCPTQPRFRREIITGPRVGPLWG